MFRLTLKNLWAYKTRLLASALSIVLGISFLAGSFVFTDTLKGLFSDLFSSSVKGVDVQVRQVRAFGDDTDNGPYEDGRSGIPESLLPVVLKVPGVVAAEGYIEGYAQPLNKKGKLVKTGGAPTFGYVWLNDSELFGYQLFSGKPPSNPNEVAFDRGLIKTTGYKLGDRVKINTLKGVKEFTLVGDATFGASDSALGATSVFFEKSAGQQLLFRAGESQSILVRGDKNATVADSAVLRTKVEAAVKAADVVGLKDLEVITGDALAKEQQSFIDTVFGFINTFFTAFAVVALFVGIFVISNSFSILVTQRTKEMAGLRILGASRSQILSATFGEALIVGLLASAVGVAGGMVVALGIKALLDQFGGGGLPSSGLVLKPRTIVVGMLVGTVVTVLSAIAPAIKSGRVKPLAALRDTQTDRAGTSKIRLVLGALFVAVSVVSLVAGLRNPGSDGAKIVGLSAGTALIAVVFLGPLLAKPIASFFGREWFGWVIAAFGVLVAIGSLVVASAGVMKLVDDGDVAKRIVPGIITALVAFGVWFAWAKFKDRKIVKVDEKHAAHTKIGITVAVIVGLYAISPLIGGACLLVLCGWYLVSTGRNAGTTAGQIARENAIRNPTRTSATALALTIGTALVSALLVFSTSLTNTFRGAFDNAIRADYVVASASSDVGFPLAVQERIASVPGVTASSTLHFERFRFGFPPRERTVGGIDAAGFGQLVSLGKVDGNIADLVKPDSVAVAKKAADDQKLKIGDSIKPTFRNGAKAVLTVVATYENAEGLGNLYYLVDNKATMSTYVKTVDADFLYVATTAKDKAGRLKVESDADRALSDYPGAEFQTKKKYVDAQVGQFQQFLAVVNALLLLAIIIAILGIANTLRLSIFERTREIGLLRAVGMSREQVKSSIRWEAIVVATFGAVLGVVLGTGFGTALVKVLAEDNALKLAIPVQYLVPLALLASIVGLYAARKPASDAARLNILRAIATE